MSANFVTTGPILALDLGKFKSVACIYDPVTARFQSITTSRADLQRLLDPVRPAVVAIEACALAGWVHDHCGEHGLACRVANTASEAWKFKHTKRKIDRDDALRLAQLEALGQLPTVAIAPQPTREWRAVIAARQGLVGRRVAVQNRIRAIRSASCQNRVERRLGPRLNESLSLLPIAVNDEPWRGLLDRRADSGHVGTLIRWKPNWTRWPGGRDAMLNDSKAATMSEAIVSYPTIRFAS